MHHHFKEGDFVRLGAHTDLFMRGVRFGTVVKVGRTYIHVQDSARPNTRPHKVFPEHLTRMEMVRVQ